MKGTVYEVILPFNHLLWLELNHSMRSHNILIPLKVIKQTILFIKKKKTMMFYILVGIYN